MRRMTSCKKKSMDLRASGNRSLPSTVSKTPSNSEVNFWADFVNDKSSVSHILPVQDSNKSGRVICARKERIKQLLLKTAQSRLVSSARRCKDRAISKSLGSTTKKTKRRLFSVKNDFLHPSKLASERPSLRHVSTAPSRPLNSPSDDPGASATFGEQSLRKVIHKHGSSKEQNARRSVSHKQSSSCPQSPLKGSTTESSSQSHKLARTRRASARIAQFEQKRQKHIRERRKLSENLEAESPTGVQDTSLGENALNLQTILQSLTPYVQRLVEEKYSELHGTPNSARHRSVKEQIAILEKKRWRYIQNRRKSLESSKSLKRKQGGCTQEDNVDAQTDHQVTPWHDVSPVSPMFTSLKPPTFFEPGKIQDQIHNCYDPSNEVLDTPKHSNASSPQTPLSVGKTVHTSGIDTVGLRDTSVLETPTTNDTFQRTTSPENFDFKSPSANVIPRSVPNKCGTPLLRRRLVRRNRTSEGSLSQSSRSDADSLCSLSSVDVPAQHETPALTPLERSPPRATPWGSVRFLVNRVRHRDGHKPAAISDPLFSSEDETDHEVVSARAAAKRFIGTSEAAGGSSADEGGKGVHSRRPAGKKDPGEGAGVDHKHLGNAVDAADGDTITDSVDGDSSAHNNERGPIVNESESSFAGGGHHDECIHGDGKGAGDTNHLDEPLGSTGGESTADGHRRSIDVSHEDQNITVKTEPFSTIDTDSDISDASVSLFARPKKKSLSKDKKHKKRVSDDRSIDVSEHHDDQNIIVKTEACHSAIDTDSDISDASSSLIAKTENKSLPKDKKHKKVVSVERSSDKGDEEQNIIVKTEACNSATDSESDISDSDICLKRRTENKRFPKYNKHKKAASACKNKETNGPSTSDQGTSSVGTRKRKEVASVTEVKKKSKGSSKSDQVTSSVEMKKHKKKPSVAKSNKKSKDSSKTHKKAKSVTKRKKSKRPSAPDPVSSTVELQERLAKRTEANRAICQSMVPSFPEEWEEPVMSPAFLHHHSQFLKTKFASLLMSGAKTKKLIEKPVKRGISVTSRHARREEKRRLKMLTEEVEADGWISYDILPQIYKDPDIKSFIKRIK